MTLYLQLFLIFFKVGLLGFGGGYAILPMIYQDVQTFGIMTADDFSNLVALSQVTPGPIAINAATYVGFKTAGTAGAFIATMAVSLPSLILILIAMMFLEKFKANKTVQAVLTGIRPATVGLMASAFLFIAQTAMLPEFSDSLPDITKVDIVGLAIFAITYLLIIRTHLGAIKLTLLGGVLGVVLSIAWKFFSF